MPGVGGEMSEDWFYLGFMMLGVILCLVVGWYTFKIRLPQWREEENNGG